nr:unnamed protein product [Callosobruchus analis]
MSDYERHRPLAEAELEAEIKRIMEGESEEESVGGSDSEDDPHFVLAESDLKSEQSADEGEGDDSQEDERNFSRRSKPVLRGKNDYRWTTEVPERRGRLQSKNLVVHLPGIKGKAKDATNILEFWNVLLDDEILSVIVTHTNQEIVRKTQNIANLQSYQDPTTIVEIKALIGLLYKAGVKWNSGLNVFELWSLRDGESIFRMTMPLNRFKFLISALRFDDKSTRDTRKKQDKLAAIREVWDKFIKNSTNSYTPYEYCTVDEQLMRFRGKCPFRIYMSSKPDKYGTKIVMLNDARTSYMVNAIPYCGKVDTQNEPVPSYYVRKLSEPIRGTNRNITVDNWFSSISLFNDMLKDHKLTMIGTLRKNKREIPPTFLTNKLPGRSLFGFDSNKTLVSYCPRANKVVLLLSSMHFDDYVDQETGKPQIVLDYNRTKGGTDTFDQLCHTYSVSRKTRRWPLRYFLAFWISAASMLRYYFHSTQQT